MHLCGVIVERSHELVLFRSDTVVKLMCETASRRVWGRTESWHGVFSLIKRGMEMHKELKVQSIETTASQTMTCYFSSSQINYFEKIVVLSWPFSSKKITGSLLSHERTVNWFGNWKSEKTIDLFSNVHMYTENKEKTLIFITFSLENNMFYHYLLLFKFITPNIL